VRDKPSVNPVLRSGLADAEEQPDRADPVQHVGAGLFACR